MVKEKIALNSTVITFLANCFIDKIVNAVTMITYAAILSVSIESKFARAVE